MYRLNFLFSLLFIGLGLNGQVLIGDPETAFAYKVKQIDEFINRFNHSPYTLILRQNPHLTHRADLYTLFNQEEDNWDYALLEEFVEETLTLSGQRILDFYDSGWYAELNCTLFYQG